MTSTLVAALIVLDGLASVVLLVIAWHQWRSALKAQAVVARLGKLLHHAYVHSGYLKCGYAQMAHNEKVLFDEVIAWARDLAEEGRYGKW